MLAKGNLVTKVEIKTFITLIGTLDVNVNCE
jgi:hypothetical protein